MSNYGITAGLMEDDEIITKIGWGFIVLGVLGLIFVSVFAVSHYLFGLPVHEGRGGRGLAPESLIAQTSLVLGGGAAFFAVLGALMLFVWKRD